MTKDRSTPPPRLSAKAGCLAMLLVLVVLGLILEAGVRLLAPTPYETLRATEDGRPLNLFDSAIGRRRPAEARWLKGDSIYQTNAAGFRDLPHELARPRDVFRVALIGDSFIEGFAVDFSDSIGGRLAGELKARWSDASTRPELLCFGLAGNDLLDYALVMREVALKYRPQVVVLALFSFNDLKPDLLQKAAKKGGLWTYSPAHWDKLKSAYALVAQRLESRLKLPGVRRLKVEGVTQYQAPLPPEPPGPPLARLRRYSRLADLVITRLLVLHNRLLVTYPETYGRWYAALRGHSSKPGEERPARSVLSGEAAEILADGLRTYRVPPDPEQAKAYALAAGILGGMLAETESADSRLMVYFLANGDAVYPELLKRELAALDLENIPHDPLQPQKRLGRALDILQVPHGGAVEAMRRAVEKNPGAQFYQNYNPELPWASIWWGHYTPLGNAVVARDLADFLAARGLPLKPAAETTR